MAGRKSLYTEELGEQICNLLASGKTLKSICDHPSMPAERTVHDWLNDTDKTAFSQSYRGAKLVQYDVLFDSMIDLARGDRSNDSMIKIQRDNLEINTIKHYTSTLNTKKYGAKPEPVVNTVAKYDYTGWTTDEIIAFLASLDRATKNNNNG